MKKITLIILSILTVISISNGQTYSTGTINLSLTSGLEYSAKIDITSTEATLTLIGPDDRWLGLGLGVQSMTNNGDVVIYTGGSNLSDMTFQGIGNTPVLDSNQNWSISSNTKSLGVRTLIATRALSTVDANDYVFSTSDTSINLVWARGFNASFTLENHGASNRGITSSGITLDTHDFELANNFKIIPNPVSSNLNLILPNKVLNAQVNIFDALGKHIFNDKISNLDSSINVSSLNKGIYLISINIDEFKYTNRFVKQ